MGKVNVVVGLSGVGKGTVLEQASKLSSKELKIINYGDKMLEVAKERGLASHRDEMKEIETGKYREIQKEAAESISDENGHVIVDTHASIKTPFGYVPGLPKWTLEKLSPSKIIMIEASASEIIERTESDSHRDRDTEEADIDEYLDVSKQMAITGSVICGAYFEVINNHDGMAEEAAEELVKLVEN